MVTFTEQEEQQKQFKEDVLRGLKSSPKFLLPKYFYDGYGDKLFQQIMSLPEYYLTDAEMEIFKTRCDEMMQLVSNFEQGFDLIELGSGDALKSSQLFKCLSDNNINYTYYPIDISGDVLDLINRTLPETIPTIEIQAIQGEYLKALQEVVEISTRPKLVLFLGANIGNMFPGEAEDFLLKLYNLLSPSDLLMIGFDLKKNPWSIFNAYNDSQGVTKEFNLNLLKRINRELEGDFNPNLFEHYESYDPCSGACKSYLISLADQDVSIGSDVVRFEENECIFMEISQKYSLREIDLMAKKTGFLIEKHLFDTRKRFSDVIMKRK
ncbi:L-histidine N(alpha)-methyltransferase [Desertivirga brevis]|uniref:L-histidine N(alpha)-methyltransferase n=1 Tax=Desertivirga brevis TaxID=2810310 RepID=UPI001A957376|nr:L-histidine N(alpha)-methyltransferase [Pedobacter sp. SYSU D00873]